ncbi:MAG: beta-ketoacyl synthase N-terminal-like domain-containing protein [Acetobacteraceae bacterium]
MRRVVVTGMGIACPLGVGVSHVWKRLLEGHSGISSIQSFDTGEMAAKIAGQVPPRHPG